MRSARCWPAILTAITCLGCAATVGVEFDPAENFSGYESWAWLERRGSQLRVSGASFWGLHDRIVEEVERALGERGFVQAAEGEEPDFFVTYHGEIKRELEEATTASASHFVPSMNSSPSYVVSGHDEVLQIYDRSRLVMDVADGREKQLVWRGSWDMRVRGDFRGQLAGAVDRIFDRFPPRGEPSPVAY